MAKKMYTYKVRVNNSEPLHKTVVVHADSDKVAENLALAKITREWSSMYSPGKDTPEHAKEYKTWEDMRLATMYIKED